ncbi:hypothetical protein HYPSUDRAFT_642515 [Hypholoma sublateritium FD-334 SS-4]|uniref:Uncharacterized protein n=1 Tax=Hypholoma sublateritium (strain FD-334 SS-4) TaxID=945553 RepID=A0A0D2MG67_HYPSF|nr:hypothetical protein HYPSUDRAFT_642515 [Hypholoma sublateritium FD-334 SS-4]
MVLLPGLCRRGSLFPGLCASLAIQRHCPESSKCFSSVFSVSGVWRWRSQTTIFLCNTLTDNRVPSVCSSIGFGTYICNKTVVPVDEDQNNRHCHPSAAQL